VTTEPDPFAEQLRAGPVKSAAADHIDTLNARIEELEAVTARLRADVQALRTRAVTADVPTPPRRCGATHPEVECVVCRLRHGHDGRFHDGADGEWCYGWPLDEVGVTE
jgi:hypothetical protein